MEPSLRVDGRMHWQGIVDPDGPSLLLERGQNDLLVGGRHLELLDDRGPEPQNSPVFVPQRSDGPDRWRLGWPHLLVGRPGRQQKPSRGQHEAARLPKPSPAERAERPGWLSVRGQLAGLFRVVSVEQPPELVIR